MEEWRRGLEAMGCLSTYPDSPRLAELSLSHPGERETLGEQAMVRPIKSRMKQKRWVEREFGLRVIEGRRQD